MKKESGENELFFKLTRTVIYKNQIRLHTMIHLLAKKWITTQLLKMMKPVKHLMGTQRKESLGNFPFSL